MDTNQSLALVNVPGLAVLLTGPVSGWIFDHMGPRTLFQLCGVIGFCAVLLLIAARHHLITHAQLDERAAEA